ncbi:MAG TPA: hypothetical protein VL995_22285 [Cellvibrio sp.]|nr:hypothetical protein [Cellvibrio sp.]
MLYQLQVNVRVFGGNLTFPEAGVCAVAHLQLYGKIHHDQTEKWHHQKTWRL